MSKIVFEYDQAYAAMCIMEEIASPTLAEEPWKDTRDQHGVAGLRDIILRHLATPCNELWESAYARYEADPNGQDPGGFDYEFVPFWLRACVDWSDCMMPRVCSATTVTE